MMRHRAALLLCGIAAYCSVMAPLAAARPAPADAVAAMETEVLPVNWQFFVAIGRCEQPASLEHQLKPESRRNPWGVWQPGYEYGINWHHPGPTYPGGLGVFAPLWTEQGIAGTDLAPTVAEATPVEQMIHAQRIIDKYGPYAWGCTGRALAVAELVDER